MQHDSATPGVDELIDEFFISAIPPGGDSAQELADLRRQIAENSVTLQRIQGLLTSMSASLQRIEGLTSRPADQPTPTPTRRGRGRPAQSEAEQLESLRTWIIERLAASPASRGTLREEVYSRKKRFLDTHDGILNDLVEEGVILRDHIRGGEYLYSLAGQEVPDAYKATQINPGPRVAARELPPVSAGEFPDVHRTEVDPLEFRILRAIGGTVAKSRSEIVAAAYADSGLPPEWTDAGLELCFSRSGEKVIDRIDLDGELTYWVLDTEYATRAVSAMLDFPLSIRPVSPRMRELGIR